VGLTVDSRVQTGDGSPLPRRELLPPILGAGVHRDDLPDRIGRAVLAGAMVVGEVVARGRHGRGAAVVPAGGAGGDGIDDGAPAPERLRVLALNLHDGTGTAGEARTSGELWAAIAALVQREHPDVLLLQEVSRLSPVNGFLDNVAELQARLQPSALVFAPGGVRAIGTAKGTAVLAFGGARIEVARYLRVADVNGEGTTRRLRSLVGTYREWRHQPDPADPAWSGYHPRNATDALIVTARGHRVRALSTHLSGGVHGYGDDAHTRSQDAQLVPLAAAIGGANAAPYATILGGDFNIRSDRPEGAREAEVLAGAGLRDAFTQVGLAPGARERVSFGRGSRIDRIYTSPGATVDAVRVLRAPGDQVSDHCAVVADLTLT
jgi:endonuclease/exonuclease/phosphatase family metal-dependent hydrolase